MFDSKKTHLFQVKKETSAKAANEPVFVTRAKKKSAQTLSGNGALKYSTTGNPFVDQFGKLGSYKAPRKFSEIEKDCEDLWAISRVTTILFILYLRIITRIVVLFNGTKTSVSQKGAELRYESIMRMLWLHNKDKEAFWNNIHLFISVGSWKDVIQMLCYDIMYHGWDGRVLDWDQMGKLLVSGLKESGSAEMIKKYLPQLKSNNKCTTVEAQADNVVAKWICSLLFGPKESSSNYRMYRQLKSSGTAHVWQQLISKKRFNDIDFSNIHGRALNLLVRSKFLKRHGLEDKYNKWAEKPETKMKYTGFVHELFGKLPHSLSGLNKSETLTINNQFQTLVDKGGENNGTRFIVVRDTSGSMSSSAPGTKMSCFDIAKALALYFSAFLKGKFANSFIEFNSKAKMHSWSGSTPLEKWFNDRCSCIGSTKFQSVIELFCEIKKSGVSEDEFPAGILCISDSEFNPTSLGKTNVDTALVNLRQAGFSEEYVSRFVIVLWNLQNNFYGKGSGEKFETYGDTPNVYYFSGYSAATIAFLDNQEIKTAADLFEEAMNQEVLKLAVV